MNFPSMDGIAEVHAGHASVLVLTKTGKLWMVGSFAISFDFPVWTELTARLAFDSKIMRFSLAQSHIVIVTDKNEIMTLGENTYSQLGDGTVDDRYMFAKPKVLTVPQNALVLQVVASTGNTYILYTIPSTFTLIVIIVSIVGGVLLLSCVAVIVIGIVLLSVYWKRKPKSFHFSAADELNSKLLIDDSESPSLSIDHSLFEINFASLKNLKEIASGAGSIIYKAQWNSDIVAIKLFKPAAFGDEKEYTRFANEIKMLASLRHYNVLNCFGAWYVCIC